MVPKENDTDKLSTEEKILNAAEKEFIAKGFDGARTTSIAASAGVTHAMLHYYFRTKEKLFEHILTKKVKLLKGMMLTPLLNSDTPLLDRIKVAIEKHLDFLNANPDLPGFMLTVLSGYPQFVEYFKKKLNEDSINIVDVLQQEIDKEAEKGLCRKIDAKMLLLDIISLNVFSFVGAPIVNNVLGEIPTDTGFISQRKMNNVEMIMRKLQ